MTEGIVIERKTGGEEPPPGMKDPGTADVHGDQGNAAPTEAASEPQNAPGITDKETQAKTEADIDVKQSQKETGLRTNGSTLDTTPRSSGKEGQRIPSLDREVSPGTMPDGSHAQTSGDRGESYTPSTMSKFKNKLHLGGGK